MQKRCCAYLRPLAGLEAAVGVDPQLLLVALEQVHVQEALDLGLDEVHSAFGTCCFSCSWPWARQSTETSNCPEQTKL